MFLLGLATLLVIDSIGPANRFHEAHRLPVDIAVFVPACCLAMASIPFRFRKRES